jgi:hypothetical protein
MEERVRANRPICQPSAFAVGCSSRETRHVHGAQRLAVGQMCVAHKAARSASIFSVDKRQSPATGRAECEQGQEMLEGVGGLYRITVAADNGYDRAEFVAGCRALNVTPHVAQNERRPGGSALDLRRTSWP